MKRLFKLLVYVLVFSVVLGSASSYAVELSANEPLQPPQRYSYLVFVSASVTISSSGTAKCVASGRISSGYNNYTVNISATLQRQTSTGWVNVKTWYGSGNQTCYLEVYKYYLASGYYYRLRSTATVYSSSGVAVETGIAYSSSVYY